MTQHNKSLMQFLQSASAGADAAARVDAILDEAYRRGSEAGEQRLRAKESAVAEMTGAAAFHAAARFLQRAKTSAAQGLCWDCGERAPHDASPYGRCVVCDYHDPN
jgi:hypothetical protein